MNHFVVDVIDGTACVSVHHDGGLIALPALWLRQHSPEATQCDGVTGQRLFDPHLLPTDLRAVSANAAGAQVTIKFSDGHTSTYDVREVLAALSLSDGVPAPIHWRADTGHPRVHHWPNINDPAVERDALDDFLTYGTIVFDGVPCVPDALRDVAQRFGFVRDTNFGPVFDVRSMPNSSDLAYRSVALSAHTDNPYRTPVPGIQMLHCLVNETTGGFSTLVDGLAAVDQLLIDDPEAVELLATVPVRFRYRDATTDIVTVRPVIDRDHDGVVSGLNYSPRLDELPLMSEVDTRRYHAARQRLAVLLASPEFEARFLLQAGQLMMFDNNRILHGRTEFNPNEGMRHLQGCYIDRDGPRTRLRLLRRQLATVSADAA